MRQIGAVHRAERAAAQTGVARAVRGLGAPARARHGLHQSRQAQPDRRRLRGAGGGGVADAPPRRAAFRRLGTGGAADRRIARLPAAMRSGCRYRPRNPVDQYSPRHADRRRRRRPSRRRRQPEILRRRGAAMFHQRICLRPAARRGATRARSAIEAGAGAQERRAGAAAMADRRRRLFSAAHDRGGGCTAGTAVAGLCATICSCNKSRNRCASARSPRPSPP